MNGKISMTISDKDYCMALLGAPMDSDLYGKIENKIKTDALTNSIFNVLISLLHDKFDFKEY